jgi:hypothetical protein
VKSGPLILLLAASAWAQQWTPLFDGRSLHGWEATGKARWTVEKGVLFGRQGEGGAAGDLFSKERFANFELEAEWSMKWPGNSGFWFKYQGPATGCQADFLDQADQPGILSGSIYCMGLQFVAVNRDPKTVRKDGWNRLRMRVEGDRAQVWMNGSPVADGRVNVFPGPGQVGLQVHPGKAFDGMEIRLRKARIRRLP